MAKVTLNDKSVRREAPATGQIELWDKTVPGFGLRISYKGARTYFVMKRVNGKLARRTVGVAPPLGVMHGAELREGEYWPADARRQARVMLEGMARGIDPKPAKSTASAPVDDLSFKAIADKYLADKLQGGGADLKSRAELERKLKTDLKDWHSRPIAEIKGREIRELIRSKAQDSPISANRLLSFVKRVFRWAASQDYIDADPAAAIDKPGKESSRDRYLTEDEIRLFWRAADKIGDPAGRLFKLALVTAQRRGEVAGLRRSELGKLEYRTQDKTTGKDVLTTGRAWLLPADRTKRGVAHTVPLSPLAAKLIDGAPKLKIGKTESDHVFPSGARGDQPISGWSRYKARLDEQIGRLMAEDAKEEYDPERHTLAPWHIHDLRATAATFMEMDRLGVPRPVISRILNHSEGDGRSMTARYTRHKWDKEAADALNLWADELAKIAGLNVVKLKGKQA
jgi:integrase